MKNRTKLLALCFLLPTSIFASSLNNANATSRNTFLKNNNIILRNWWKGARTNNINRVNKMWDNEKFSKDLSEIIVNYTVSLHFFYKRKEYISKLGSGKKLQKKILFENSDKKNPISQFSVYVYSNGNLMSMVTLLDKSHTKTLRMHEYGTLFGRNCVTRDPVPLFKMLRENYHFLPDGERLLDSIINKNSCW